MFLHYRTKSFVLKEQERGEADKLFTVFAKDFGKLEVLGRAIRKMKSKLRAGIPLFSFSEIEFIQGKAYKTLTDAVLIKYFENIKKDSQKFEAARRISETFDNLVKGQEKDEKTWRLLNEVFVKLNSFQLSMAGCRLLYYYFFWKFVSFLGYQPELYQCLICTNKLKPKNLYFGSEGGIICDDCYQKEKPPASPIDPNIIKILREILKRDPTRFLKLKVKKKYLLSLEKVSDFYLSFVLSTI